ncbi:MAG: FlgD immunoglobulin-like domain containing protein, partial [Calditrichota bacterium]
KFYAYGARSFSIWDDDGNLIYDSGNEMELLTSQILPNDFNSTNDENDSFDNRSDDKGPEPEGVVVGSFNGRIYAFIGLERVGGIMVYDVTDPANACYVTYVNNRDFSVIFDDPTPAELAQVGDLGPEGLAFIDGAESPNGHSLLVVASEVSGSISIYQLKELSDNNDPFCEVVNVIPGPPVSIEVEIQDDESGIASVEILKAKNADVVIPEFVSGTTGLLTITATKINPSKGSSVVLKVTDRAGNETICDPVYTTLSTAIPEDFELEQNYPNPFNPETTIRFAIRGNGLTASPVTLRIYNVAGQLVNTLIDEPIDSGSYSVVWNGRDDAGNEVASGVYIYRLVTGDFVQTRKMMLIR